MKVVCLQGSPRKRGNTVAAVDLLEGQLTEAGHEVETIHVADHAMTGCTGCMACQADPDELMCTVDDFGNEILQKMAGADAVVYATPLYCWDFTAQMKPVLDRCLAMVTGFMDPATHKSHMDGTRTGLLCTCGGPEGEGNTDTLSMIYSRMAQFGKCDDRGECILDGCMGMGELTAEHEAKVKAFGEKLMA